MARNLYLTDLQQDGLIEILEKSKHAMATEILNKLDEEKDHYEMSKGEMINKILEIKPELKKIRGRFYNSKKQDVILFYEAIVKNGLEKEKIENENN